MRTTVRFIVTTLLGLTALAAATAPAMAADSPIPSKQEHLYTIPVGAITDLGDLTKIGILGYDFAGLLGQ
jgi:hypothetical protein